ncbi:MAG: putative lipid II flippase MurJ [Candidatus Binatia bacterium]|nr:MAG: putative lipid II flippase MurJ [Candidatus Binatia bacterium]
MSEPRRVLRAAGLVGSLTLLSRVAGLLRDVVVGYFFGSGQAADAFFVAFRLPNLLRRFVAEGAASVAVVPVFTEIATTRGPERFREALRAVTGFFFVTLAALTALGVLFAPALARLFAPGFTDEPEKYALTVSLTRWVFPYIFFVSLVAVLGGVLNSLRHFAAPALAPFLFNLAVIVCTVALVGRVEPPVFALAYGVLLGGVVQLALQLFPLARRELLCPPAWNPRDEALGKIRRLLAPTLFGNAVYQVNVLFGTILASLLPAGSVSYLWYADRVFEFPLGIVAVALGTAALPTFSSQAARRDYAELARTLQFAIRGTTFVALPAAVGIAVLAEPICGVLFRRGAFGSLENQETARALVAFAVGLWSVAMVRIVAPVFYALHDARTPVAAALVSLVANVLLSVALMGPVEGGGPSSLGFHLARLVRAVHVADLDHAGLALATSLAATVNLAFLLVLLLRRIPELELLSLWPTLGRSLVASAAMIPAVRSVAGAFAWEAEPLLPRALGLGLSVAAGVLVYAGVATALGAREPALLLRVLRERLSPRPA